MIEVLFWAGFAAGVVLFVAYAFGMYRARRAGDDAPDYFVAGESDDWGRFK